MIRVGLCGAGFMGKMHAACYAALPGVKVVAVSDAQTEVARESLALALREVESARRKRKP